MLSRASCGANIAERRLRPQLRVGVCAAAARAERLALALPAGRAGDGRGRRPGGQWRAALSMLLEH